MISARKLTLKTTRKPEKIAALARAIADEKSTRAAFEQLAPQQKMLLRLLREQGGQSTIGALKIAANALGITGFDAHFHQLLRYALVLYSTPSRVRHELWDASVAAYNSWEADLNYGIEGVELALVLADDSIELPPPAHSLEVWADDPFFIEDQSPRVVAPRCVWRGALGRRTRNHPHQNHRHLAKSRLESVGKSAQRPGPSEGNSPSLWRCEAGCWCSEATASPPTRGRPSSSRTRRASRSRRCSRSGCCWTAGASSSRFPKSRPTIRSCRVKAPTLPVGVTAPTTCRRRNR